VIRIHDLVKFIGPAACKYFTRQGTQNAVVEDGTIGIILWASTEDFYAPGQCEVLVGNEVFNASINDLAVIQSGGQNVV